MSREKIKVPGKVYEELIALQREIHFTQNHQDTIKKAQDRGYMNAANWIRQNENAYKIGFAWGFEPSGDEPTGKKTQKSTSTKGIIANIKKMFGK